jgi:hypothetical protein
MGMHVRYHECAAKNSFTKCTPGTKRYGKFCAKHKNQYDVGIIDENGNKLRDFIVPSQKKFKECLAKNAGTGDCTKLTGRFCCKHQKQYAKGIIDLEGHKLRDLDFSWKGKRKYQGCVAEGKGYECGTYTKGRFCGFHQGQNNNGIIDKEGNLLRAPSRNVLKFKECLAKNAGTGPCSMDKKGRFCSTHYTQFYSGIIDRNGNKIRDFRIIDRNGNKISPLGRRIQGGYVECSAKNAGTGECTDYVVGRRFCNRHHSQFHVLHIIDGNGNKIRDPQTMEKCGVPGCAEHAGHMSGLCHDHYIDIVTRGNFTNYPSLNPTLSATMPIKDVVWSIP